MPQTVNTPRPAQTQTEGSKILTNFQTTPENTNSNFLAVAFSGGEISSENLERLMDLYEAMKWWGTIPRDSVREGFSTAMKNSYKVVAVQDMKTGRFVAAGRILSDGIRYGCIFDVVVLPEFQKRGLGRLVMEKLVEGNEGMNLHLTSTFGNESFYKKLGWKKHKTAFGKYPGKSEYLEENDSD